MSQSKFGDFLNFRIMISPVIILVLFWLGLVAIVIAAIALFTQAKTLAGVGTLILGPFAWRIICEYMILGFRMHACLEAIAKNAEIVPLQKKVRDSRQHFDVRGDASTQKRQEYEISIDDVAIDQIYQTRNGNRFKVVAFADKGLKVEYSDGKMEVIEPIDPSVPHGLWAFDIKRI